MRHYLAQAAFNSQGWTAWVSQPHSCQEKIQSEANRLGGKLHSLWWAFGEYDNVLLFEMPDDVSMSAFSMFAQSLGAFKSFDVTSLMTDEEALQALRKAAQLGAGRMG